MTDHPPVEHLGIYAALASAQADMGPLVKNATNPHFKNKYADIGSILELIKQPLMDNQLALYQSTTLADLRTCLSTTLTHIPTGEFVESTAYLPGIDDPQKIGSAITYYRRYQLMCLFNLNAEDDDGQSASSRTTTRETAPKELDRKHPPKPEMWEANIQTVLLMDDEKERKPRLAQLGRESLQWGEPFKEVLLARVNDPKFSEWLGAQSA